VKELNSFVKALLYMIIAFFLLIIVWSESYLFGMLFGYPQGADGYGWVVAAIFLINFVACGIALDSGEPCVVQPKPKTEIEADMD
jgi:hypothetical protein